jgi:ubiquinone/menaquinone biosynthesis C-methylase UbiE
MSSDTDWTRRRAVEVHDETATKFFAEYGAKSTFDSPFRYGRQLIDRSWARCVSQLPAGGRCLDIGCGVGAHMARLLEQNFEVVGIEPSVEMRRLAKMSVPAELVTDGSVLQLPAPASSFDFVYAIEVFRYLNTHDNERGHSEIARVLRPSGIYFGTYVNKWALDGFRQLSQLRRLASRLTGVPTRYHVEFETPSSLTEKLRQAGFSDVSVHGAMLAPLRIRHKLLPSLATTLSRHTMPHEEWLSDSRSVRPFAAHLIAIARR